MASYTCKKTVLLIGATGVGKSYIGNILLGEERFVSSADDQSVTSEIASYSAKIDLPQGAGQLELRVVDTPGIGDTKGRSIEFLDSIIAYIRENTINMIIIVNQKERMSQAVANHLTALKECLTRFNDTTTALIINKMPRPQTLKKYKTGPKTVKECEEESTKSVFKALDCSPIANVISILNDSDESEDKQTAENVYAMVINSNEVDKKEVKTWTERLKYYQGVVDGSVSAHEAAEFAVIELRKSRESIKNDVQWHKDRIHNCSTAGIVVCWVPIAGWVTAIGLGAAVLHSKYRIPVLEAEIIEIDQQIADFENATTKNEKALEDAKKKLKCMESIFART